MSAFNDEMTQLHRRMQAAWRSAPPSQWNVRELRLICTALEESVVPHVVNRRQQPCPVIELVTR